jgi:hypothetical protein
MKKWYDSWWFDGSIFKILFDILWNNERLTYKLKMSDRIII